VNRVQRWAKLQSQRWSGREESSIFCISPSDLDCQVCATAQHRVYKVQSQEGSSKSVHATIFKRLFFTNCTRHAVCWSRIRNKSFVKIQWMKTKAYEGQVCNGIGFCQLGDNAYKYCLWEMGRRNTRTSVYVYVRLLFQQQKLRKIHLYPLSLRRNNFKRTLPPPSQAIDATSVFDCLPTIAKFQPQLLKT
jgi:hypothetical protein